MAISSLSGSGNTQALHNDGFQSSTQFHRTIFIAGDEGAILPIHQYTDIFLRPGNADANKAVMPLDAEQNFFTCRK